MRKFVYLLILTLFIINCKAPEARKPISSSSGSFINESIARNKKLYDAESKQILDLIKETKDTSFIASTNGFWYKYNTKIESDTLVTPKFGDIVNFTHSISEINGRSIYDSIPARDYAMDQQELFTGLREGLKLMKAGETVTFLFPSQKGYGYYGDSNKIGANIPLQCKVTINSIHQKK